MHYILTVTCADAIGIVAATATYLADHDGFIVESQQYADLAAGRFFMRIEFKAAGPRFPALTALQHDFAPIAARFTMDWAIVDADTRPRVMIAVSRFGHCLNDLLHRWRTGTLPVEIPLVVSNHLELRSFCEWHGIPFVHLPIADGGKAAQEQRLLELVDEHRIDLVVLARYMQVLSADACAALAWRCINIHHSFLPSFKGAKPYSQAHAKGVKLIGASAHFVTANLDEGPIIEQDVRRVDHGFSVEAMIEAGRDVESAVLSRAVTWAAERRILPNGATTVVFTR